MAEQVVTLNPGESKVVSFTATPSVAKTYQVAVDGLTGSFVASEIPVELASVYGVVTFRETGAPLSGVKVSIGGRTTYTNTSGEYLIENLAPGNYLMTLEKEGYEPLSDTVTIVAGNNEINAEMTLVPALMASLHGYVTDADTGAAIANAEITVVEKTGLMEANVYEGTTNASGFYSMANMAFENSPIVVDISFKAIRYEMLIMENVPLAEGDNELNVQIIPKEIPGEPALISVDYPEQIDIGISGPDVWAGQTVSLPYTSGVMYSFGLTVWSDYYAHRIQLERAEYLAADIYDELEAKGLSPGEKYIRFPESGQYTHYGMEVESYGEPARVVYMPYGVYPVRSFASVYHVEVGYHLGNPYTKRTKISDLWTEDVGTVEIVMPVGDWVWPTGHNDPSDSWTGEKKAYDGDLDTYTGSVSQDLNEWSGFLEFTFDSPIMSDKARFNADFLSGLNDEIDLDIHRDGVWINVYQGFFVSRAWVETSFPQGSVDKARIRMRHTTNPKAACEWLYEFQLWSS